MKNIMFAFELFSIYFCAACCLMHKPSDRVASKHQGHNEDIAETEENKIEPNISINGVEEKTEEPILADVTTDGELQLDWEVDFKNLSLSACRKIAGKLSKLDKDRLGISQKVNSKDKPLEQLQQEIKSRFRHYPDEVGPVVRSHCNAKARIENDKTVPLAPKPQRGQSKTA